MLLPPMVHPRSLFVTESLPNIGRFKPCLTIPTLETTGHPNRGCFRNIVGKGRNAGNQHLVLAPQCFLPFQRQIQLFQSQKICVLNLEESKILSSRHGFAVKIGRGGMNIDELRRIIKQFFRSKLSNTQSSYDDNFFLKSGIFFPNFDPGLLHKHSFNSFPHYDTL